jgi:hypothetical protein
VDEERTDDERNAESRGLEGTDGDAEGAKQADNPDLDEEGGLGTQTGAVGGAEATKPEGGTSTEGGERPDQTHPHGASGA